MSKEIETLIKIQGKINKNKYHLHVDTDLEKEYRWVLFLNFPNREDYFSNHNIPIMYSNVDSIEDLDHYLNKHEGYIRGVVVWIIKIEK